MCGANLNDKEQIKRTASLVSSSIIRIVSRLIGIKDFVTAPYLFLMF